MATSANDFVGQRFGMLTVLGEAPRITRNRTRAAVRCDCGTEKSVDLYQLRRGMIRACGCRLRAPRGRVVPVRVGDRAGRLVVIARAQRRGRNPYVLVRCDCGSEPREVATVNFRSGGSQSCGCLARERASEVNLTHGGTGTVEHQTWNSMRQRCENPANDAWANYGGRGVRVCERWQSFENFLADMGHRPSDAHSIDRIDVNGNYEPGNCRWATFKQQSRNTRRAHMVEVDGQMVPAADLYDRAGVSHQLYHLRVKKGWDRYRAATTPPMHSVVVEPTVMLEVGGVTRPLVEWAREAGVHIDTARSRLRRGLPPEQILSPEPVRRGRKPRHTEAA